MDWPTLFMALFTSPLNLVRRRAVCSVLYDLTPFVAVFTILRLYAIIEERRNKLIVTWALILLSLTEFSFATVRIDPPMSSADGLK